MTDERDPERTPAPGLSDAGAAGGESGGDAPPADQRPGASSVEPSEQAAEEAEETGRPGPLGRLAGTHTGFYFYGVVRTRGWRGREREEVLRVRYRDLEALVRPGPFKLPALDSAHVQAHQRLVEGIMRRGTVLPAPYGVVFRGRRALVRFLEDQYLALDEGLAFVEGHWEMRVHATPKDGEPSAEMEDLAVHVYAELRRSARAAIPFPRDEGRLVSAAFLVERGAWIEFVNRADDLVAAQPALAFDVTGPWPPYDFVRMTV